MPHINCDHKKTVWIDIAGPVIALAALAALAVLTSWPIWIISAGSLLVIGVVGAMILFNYEPVFNEPDEKEYPVRIPDLQDRIDAARKTS